jgi:nucleoid-associated protein YgaU
VSVAVLIAVIWDIQNEKPADNGDKAKTEEFKNKVPDNIAIVETPSPETPGSNGEQHAPIDRAVNPEEPSTGPATVKLPGEAEEAAPAVTPTFEPGPGIPDLPGTGEKYVIQSNDNLHKIAQKFYGDKNLWRRIYEANIDIIQDPEVLIVGTQITIPPKEERAATPSRSSSVETYIVMKGDTLTRISRMHYGDDAHVELIYQANRDVIKDKNVLVPGTVLVIPPAPEKEP